MTREPRFADRDPGARTTRQQEADGMQQERIDEQEHDRGEDQDAQTCDRSAGKHGEQRDRRHHGGPEHRGFETSHGGEEQHHDERGCRARAQPQPPQAGGNQRQHERNVLSGDREEV